MPSARVTVAVLWIAQASVPSTFIAGSGAEIGGYGHVAKYQVALVHGPLSTINVFDLGF